MSYTVASELDGRLAVLGATLNVPVAFEGVEFDKPSGNDGSLKPFMEAFLIPATTLNVTVDGGRKREVGVYKVNVWSPSGTGTGDARSIAQSVVDAFPIVPKTGLVSIESTPSVGRIINDVPGWLILPVTISYRYEH